jgi:multidrug efflux pump subunit AcrA (membrane-fusion protein)
MIRIRIACRGRPQRNKVADALSAPLDQVMITRIDAVVAPPKTPARIVAKLNVDINEALRDPAILARFSEFSAEAVGGSPAETAKYFREEVERWNNVIKAAAVKLGPQFGDLWVVESGLQVGESVVVDGLQRIKNGMTVAPTPFKDTQANANMGEQ